MNKHRPPSPQVAPAGPEYPEPPHPTLPGRTAGGRFAPSNTAAVTLGHRSEQLARAHTPLKEDLVRQILTDRGYVDTGPPPTAAYSMLVNGLAGAGLILEHVETFIRDSGGPISAKGRTRRALTAYLQVLDRVMRLAQLVGVDRVERHAPQSIREWLMAERAPDADAEPTNLERG